MHESPPQVVPLGVRYAQPGSFPRVFAIHKHLQLGGSRMKFRIQYSGRTLQYSSIPILRSPGVEDEAPGELNGKELLTSG